MLSVAASLRFFLEFNLLLLSKHSLQMHCVWLCSEMYVFYAMHQVKAYVMTLKDFDY